MNKSQVRIWRISLFGFIAALFFLGFHTLLRYQQLSHYQQLVRTEYAESSADGNQRTSQIFFDSDSYLWTRFAQDLQRAGTWRLRHTSADNAPEGREVHWSSGLTWLIMGLGYIRSATSTVPAVQSIEQMAVFAAPLVLALLLVLVTTSCSLFKRPWFGVILTVGLVSSPQLFWTFFTGRPDHHAIISAAAMGTILFLLLGQLGWQRTAEKRKKNEPAWLTPHTCFVASAIFGAVLLWTSALTAAVVLTTIALAVLVAQTFTRIRSRDDEVTCTPSLWRTWGLTGSILALIFYAIEYLPSHLSMRLEVNHPLYALAWWGGGELLFVLTGGRKDQARRFGFLSVIALAGVLLLPVAILITGGQWYGPCDPFMWRVHQFIDEFRPYLAAIDGSGIIVCKDFGAILLFVPISASLLFANHLARRKRMAIIFSLTCVFTFTALTLWQYRWSSLLAIALATNAAVCATAGWRFWETTKWGSGVQLLLVILIAGQAFYFGAEELKEASDCRRMVSRTRRLARQAIIRDVAQELRKRAGDRPVTVLSGPGDTTALCYHGKFDGIASLYWENAEGLQYAADVFSCLDIESAEKLIRQRHITHVVLFMRHSHLGEYLKIHTGSFTPEAFRETFGYRLFETPPQHPDWLLPLQYLMPFRELDGFPDAVRIYEVLPPRK